MRRRAESFEFLELVPIAIECLGLGASRLRREFRLEGGLPLAQLLFHEFAPVQDLSFESSPLFLDVGLQVSPSGGQFGVERLPVGRQARIAFAN